MQGRELIMELDDHDLRLIDPDSLAVLHTQPIHQIRVWGVGRDNGRYECAPFLLSHSLTAYLHNCHSRER